ncbi:MAG: urease accessory protein UreE, partial [Paracoccaceae bacterium]|nr:urease accessory protein UreE [Paracoccaceae bacterium]
MTKDTLFARATEPACFAQRATFDQIRLDYDARFLRRKRLLTEGGLSVMVDLPETISLNAGDALLLEDGRAIS